MGKFKKISFEKDNLKHVHVANMVVCCVRVLFKGTVSRDRGQDEPMEQ
jgi:hypothetical protein